MDNLIGRKLDGRYEIVKQIGQGGMANVYRAIDVSDGSTVAVKVLREEFLDNEELLRRFKNESKAIALLSHPNIVKVFDVNFSDATQYIVMEYIEGITLMQYLEHKKRLGWKDALHFTVQVLRALQHAHDRGIVHRDIKPQNIMLMKDGTIKVMDFGIARFSRSQTRTITDKAIGSVHYISPEQAKGGETDAKSDIYSLGVMLYEMLTGSLPFESDSAVSVAIQQISAKPKSLREIDPTIPEPLEEITLRAMAKDPADRYASAAQMLRDIDEFKANPSIKFEYKYLDGESTKTKYEDAVKSGMEENGDAKPVTAIKVPSDKKLKRKKGKAVPILIGFTFACGIAALVLMFLTLKYADNSIFAKYPDVELPVFVQQTIADVQANKDYDSFTFTIVEEYNSEVPEGVVYSQFPEAPKTVKANTTVTLYVSKGVEMIEVPDVNGMLYNEALDLLISRHFVVVPKAYNTTKVKANRAYGTDLKVGELVEAWTVITMYYREAAITTTRYMPSLIGLQTATARTSLSNNGLKIGEITEDYSLTIPKGRIMWQQFPEGTLMSTGSTVMVTVSLGAPEVDMNVTISGYGDHTVSWTYTDAVIGAYSGDPLSTDFPTTVKIQGNGTIVVTVVREGGSASNPDDVVTNAAEPYAYTYSYTVADELTGAPASVSVNVDVSDLIPTEWDTPVPDEVNMNVNISGYGDHTLSWTYTDDYRGAYTGTPLSTSFPTTVKIQDNGTIAVTIIREGGSASNPADKVTHEYAYTYPSTPPAGGMPFNIDVSSIIPSAWTPVEPDVVNMNVTISGYGDHTVSWTYTDGHRGAYTGSPLSTSFPTTVQIQGNGTVNVTVTRNGHPDDKVTHGYAYTYPSTPPAGGMPFNIDVSSIIPSGWAPEEPPDTPDPPETPDPPTEP